MVRHVTQLLDVPGGAHELVGRVEVRGRYLEDLLLRVLAQIRPSTKSDWLELLHTQPDVTHIVKIGPPRGVTIQRQHGLLWTKDLEP